MSGKTHRFSGGDDDHASALSSRQVALNNSNITLQNSPTVIRGSAVETILVYAGVLSASDNLVRCAVSVANLFGSKIYGVTTPLAPRGFDHGSTRDEGASDALTYASMEAAGERFKDLTALAVNGASWSWSEASAFDALQQASHGADLIMVNPSYVSPRPAVSWRRSFSSALTLGRPVLITPWLQCRFEIKRVAIFWTDSASCRRAISDALPFLQMAREVTVVHCLIQPDECAVRRRLEEVGAALWSQGVATRIVILPRMTGRLSEILIGAAIKLNADLVVAGAYRHGPFRIRASGSITDGLLKSLPTALLLSR